MTLTYFCDIDTHLKKICKIQISQRFFRDTSGARATALARRCRANLNTAPKANSRSANGVFSYQTFRITYRFRDIGVQRSTIILGAPRKSAIFRLPLQRRLVRYRLRIGSLVGLMKALYRNNFGWPWPILWYWRTFKGKLKNSISQSYSSECSQRV